MTVIKLSEARRKKKLENDLWAAMDALLDQLRAICVVPAMSRKHTITMSEKERLEILRLDRNYYNALRAGSPERKKMPPYPPAGR